MREKTESIRERFRERADREGSVPKLGAAEVEKIKHSFSANPDWSDLYLFHDGHIEGGEEFRRSCSGRAAVLPAYYSFYVPGLVSIATKGIPVNIGRGHSQIRLERVSE